MLSNSLRTFREQVTEVRCQSCGFSCAYPIRRSRAQPQLNKLLDAGIKVRLYSADWRCSPIGL
jgi:hypothetical protein